MCYLSRDVTQEKLIEEERERNQERTAETKIALFNILEDVKESEKISKKSVISRAYYFVNWRRIIGYKHQIRNYFNK